MGGKHRYPLLTVTFSTVYNGMELIITTACRVCVSQGRNFREAMKAMAVVVPRFGLVPRATVALMSQPQDWEFLTPLTSIF